MRRPHLGTHVQVRRHLVGDRSCVVLHDLRGARRMVVGEREWRVLRAMDGTRDVEGLAAASGVPITVVRDFAGQLDALGLFEATEPAPIASLARDIPVRALPGYAFRCTGVGGCCSTIDSVLFTPLEAARARGAAPDVLDAGYIQEHAFFPERGLDTSLLAVAMRDGSCAYLRDDRRCGVYAVRPHGCRTSPRRHVDVGSEIRVAPRIACACELDPGDAPLTEASRGADLPPALWVERLPQRIRVGPDTLDAADAVAWSDALEWGDDVHETCARHADRLGAAPFDREALAARLEQVEREHAWRAEQDRIRWTLRWMRVAVDSDEETVETAHEQLAARAHTFVGGLLVDGDAGAALRGLEGRLFLARRLPEASRARSFAKHPIAAVNAVARATGLW